MTARDRPSLRPPADLDAYITLIILFVFLYLIRSILLPFAAPAVIAYICTPLVDGIARRFRVPRMAAVTVVFLAFACAASLLGWLGLPPLMHEAQHIVADFPAIVKTLAQRVVGPGTIAMMGEHYNAAQISAAVMQGMKTLVTQGGRLLLLAGWTFAGLFAFFLAWVLFFYFLASAHQIGRGLFWLVPLRRRAFTEATWRRLDPTLRRYFVGIGIVVCYACVAAYIGMGLILQLRHAVFLALLAGLLEMIPVAGPGLSALIGGMAAISQAKGIAQVISYVIYAIALRLSIDQLLGPVVLGRAARVPVPLVIFGFLAGGVLFGITGVVLAVPFCLAIKAAVTTAREQPLVEPQGSQS